MAHHQLLLNCLHVGVHKEWRIRLEVMAGTSAAGKRHHYAFPASEPACQPWAGVPNPPAPLSPQEGWQPQQVALCNPAIASAFAPAMATA